MAITIVAKYVVYNSFDLFFQSVDKLCRFIFVAFYFAQEFLPSSGEFCTFEQVLFYQSDEFCSRGCREERFARLADVVAAEECFDNGGSC